MELYQKKSGVVDLGDRITFRFDDELEDLNAADPTVAAHYNCDNEGTLTVEYIGNYMRDIPGTDHRTRAFADLDRGFTEENDPVCCRLNN